MVRLANAKKSIDAKHATHTTPQFPTHGWLGWTGEARRGEAKHPIQQQTMKWNGTVTYRDPATEHASASTMHARDRGQVRSGQVGYTHLRTALQAVT